MTGGERATESGGDEVLASEGNLTLNEIDQMKPALYQMDEGSDGTCLKCGEVAESTGETKVVRKRLHCLSHSESSVLVQDRDAGHGCRE